ncbi:hypothetical protein Pla22_35510 [Rubripirellula amarantea]|uniref:Uncharacterized protein n=1 Tax=Rubripirellula amarantea TaxID=2527999 RepID=A0A5C5WJ80_9BACT|nr:hypothetical protein [Rubripirellula amarantea]TWT50808.1 hypothetical protein Pla22_35510 [Rubripirellula amarantea]
MSNPSRLKKPLLYGLIGSVLIGAAVGILFVIRNTWTWFELRVVLTTVVIAGASLCGLACDLSRTPKGMNLMPKTGLSLVGLAAILLLGGLWIENDSELYWKTTICASILAVTTVHVCLLSIARLANRFRWVYVIGSQIIFGYAMLLCGVIIGEIDGPDIWRFIAALSIIVMAITLVIPILHRISKMEVGSGTLASPIEQRNMASIDEEIVRLQERILELERLKESLRPKEPTPTL